MILSVHSDASYLSKPKVLVAISSYPTTQKYHTTTLPYSTWGISNGSRACCPQHQCQRISLQTHHLQGITPLQTDIAMADAVVNGKVYPKRTKAMTYSFTGCTTENAQNNFKFKTG